MRRFLPVSALLAGLLTVGTLCGFQCPNSNAPEGEGSWEGQAGEGQPSALEGEPVEGDDTPAEGETVTSTCPADCGYTVVHTYPHDPEAFTQGLVYESGVLYEGTGLYGSSSLRKVQLETGEVLRKHDLTSAYFGEGIALFNGKIYQLTWKNKHGFVYSVDSFAVTSEFSYTTEGWGLTHDGNRLIMSDGSANLYFLDPDTLERTGELAVHDAQGSVTRLNELEWVNGEILANVWQTDDIVRIDPISGSVKGRIHLGGLLSLEDRAGNPDVLNGIAYDATQDRLFVTGKLWPKLFEIRLVPQSAATRK